MSLSTKNSLLPYLYPFFLKLMVGLPNIAIIVDVVKNTNLSQKNKMIIYSLTFAAILAIVYSKNTLPIGLALSVIAIILVKKMDKDVNCVLYTTLLSQNLLLGTLMSIQYMLK